MMSPKALPVSVPAAVSGEQNASTATATTTTNTTSTAARRGPRWCNRSISFAMLAACVLFGNYWDVLISEGTRKSYIKEAKSKYDSYQNKSKLLRMKSRAKFGKRNPTTTSSNTTTTNNTAANFSETGSQSKHIAQAWSSTQPRLWFREEILSKVNHTLSKEKQGGELPLPPKTMGAFIHLGKTGGSTMCAQLRFACHSFLPKPCQQPDNIHNESYISKLTTYIHVPDFPLFVNPRHKSQYTNFDFYVVTLRDVYARFLSAFTYMHPLNELENRREAGRVFSCFPTLESFTDALGDEPIPEDDFSAVSDDIGGDSTLLEENCTKLARVVIRNHPIAKHAAAHFFYDTRLVMDWANINTTRTPILAVRTEQMWDDWISVNQWLGQEHVATFPEVKGRVFDKDQYKVKKEISETGQRRLCRALIPEYRVYLKTSFKAVNLSPEDKDRSFQLAMKNCGPEIEQAMIAER